MRRQSHIKQIKASLIRLLVNLSWFVSVLVFVGCHRSAIDHPKGIPEALLIVSDAMDIQYSAPYGTQQVYYQVKACYPGRNVIDEISKGMQQRNWLLLDEDFLNAGIKSNHARGQWSTFLDHNNNYIYQWIEDWKDSSGDIVRYGLRYIAKNKENPTKNCNMEVTGTLFSKKALDETLSHQEPGGK
jgi:hypothetical protein